ncbi:hypothetical protein HDF16_003967 [Granulicella aggregans]|uniref:DUF4352 domain-containing protein n=1 Tax=Granulicella aggregans TaxID=474949 RepID=A0A7W7ZG03_9BACT|nr:hypothetical protein [Granulicella aggregans]MBB5059244.1 hypothetical protein [Granulicella aggregans]
MKIAVWLFFAVAGWCAIGLLGTVVSLARNRRAEAVKNVAWVTTVAGVYLVVLLAVSAFQKQRVVAIEQNQCFGSMCFRVIGVDEVPGLVSGATDRVVRVRIAIANRGRSAAEEPAIRAYLLDSRGRRWVTLPGLTGNRLTSRIAGESEIVSQPMFRVGSDATGLGLVLTHGSWQSRNLIIGDSDSVAHKPTIVALGR